MIGNPPYVRQEILGEDFKKYAQSKFASFAGTADLSVYFIEKSLNLINSKGIYSVIVANKWMRANYGEPLRKLLKQKQIHEIIDFGDLPVFTGATTYPCIIKINNNKPQNFKTTQIKTLEFASLKEEVDKQSYSVDVNSLDDKGWSLSNQKESALLDKIKKAGIPLGEYVDGKIYYGIKTGLNEAFVIDEETKNRLIREDPKCKEVIKPFLEGKDIKRYANLSNKKWLILFPKGFTNQKKKEIKGYKIESEYPAIFSHLKQFQKKAEARYDQGEYWWELRACDYYNEFENEKIIYAEISIKGAFTFDSNCNFSDTTSYIIPLNSKYLLAVLNSQIFSFLFKKKSSEIRGGFLRWKRQYMSEIPIPRIDLNNAKQKEVHDKIVSLVDTMLLTQKELSTATTDIVKKTLNQKIELVDNQINALVYGLYGLTEEEIGLVEGENV